MVKGLDPFKAHFEGFSDRYVLIGGAACYLGMTKAGLDFRVTKDLDIVLCLEALDARFVGVFWDFIKKGGYQNRQKSTGKKLFYRFIQCCKDMSGGITVVPPEGLIPLKAKAWLELNRAHHKGGKINQKDMKKHKNDVFRLFQIIAPDNRMALPKSIAHDLNQFLVSIETDPPKDLKPFGLGNLQLHEVIDTIRAIYKLSL